MPRESFIYFSIYLLAFSYVSEVFHEDGHSLTQLFRKNQAPTFELLGDCLSDDAVMIIFGLLHGKKIDSWIEILACGTSGVFVAIFALYIGYGLLFIVPAVVNEDNGRSASFLTWCCVGPLALTFAAATVLLVPYFYLFFDDLAPSAFQATVLHLAGVCLVLVTLWAFMARGAMEVSFAAKEGEEKIAPGGAHYRALETK